MYLAILLSCKNDGDEYIGSTTDFKAKFRMHKSGIKIKIDRCCTARNFNNKCCDSSNPHMFLQVQLIKSVESHVKLEGKL